MNNACGVSSVESVCNLSGKQKKSFHLQRTPRNAVLQRHALEKLHDDERLAFVLPDFMNGADIWMVQADAARASRRKRSSAAGPAQLLAGEI